MQVMPIHEADRAWTLETRDTAYAVAVNAQGILTHTYWGPRLAGPSDSPAAETSSGWASFNNPQQIIREEYPGFEGAKYTDPCLKLTYPDGVRDVAPRFAGADVKGSRLVVTLRDPVYPLNIELHYMAHEALNLIERWATLRHTLEEPVEVERAFSAQWHLPRGADYRLSHLTGRWLDEFHLRRDPLPHGITSLESRRLTTSHHHNPWFALDDGTATEDTGRVYFGLLAWSGNWRLAAEVTDFESTRVNIGLNDFDFNWRLRPGETFETPHAFAGFTTGGFGEASRALHRLVRSRLPHGKATHPVLYNSWEATFFDVTEPRQKALADTAASIGVELFVVDDGWFVGRQDDTAGLGDWVPDPDKFPNGLGPLIEHVKARGMRFGLWVEPEMVNPRSRLYDAHPDWVLHFPTREREEARNQLILNLGRPDVQEHLITVLDDLLGRHDISFIKWDMNRNASQPGWPDAPGDPREVWMRYVQGLYHVLGTLRERHPKVTFQSCSGGGGRVDAEILRYADQAWTSDNTLADARLDIQHGFSQAYPAAVMEAWVTDAGAARLPLEFRFHVAMSGVLGVGANLDAWTLKDREQARTLIGEYKTWRDIVQHGEQYRLTSGDGLYAVQYVNDDKTESALIVARTHRPEPAQLPPVYLRGLKPECVYALRAAGSHAERQALPAHASGAALMNVGLNVNLSDFESFTLHLTPKGQG